MYIGANENTSEQINAQLKFVGTKKEGGFIVIDDDKVYFEMEWRDSATLEFDHVKNSVKSTGA